VQDKYMIAMFAYLPGRGNCWVPLAWVVGPRRFAQAWKDIHQEYPNHTIRGFQRVDSPSLVLWEVADEDNFLKEVEAWEMLSLEKQASLAEGIR
jgi:hypothetical protein